MTDGEESRAREEGLFESVGLAVCPKISWTQFIVIISIIEFVTFVISCCIYGLSNRDALAPDSKALALLGWKDARKIKNDYQLWRLVAPTFLHGSAYHLNANIASQLFLGSGIEHGIEVWRMIFLYFTCGVGGMLLSCILKPESFGIGASTSVFGLVGYLVSYVFTNWQYMGRVKPGQRIYLSILTFLIVAINMNIGPMADGNVDNFGHLGGLITGILVGMTLAEQYDREARSGDRVPDRFTPQQYSRRERFCNYFFCNYLGHLLLGLYFIAGFTVFYMYTDVDIEQDS